jgi:hypothetical protein
MSKNMPNGVILQETDDIVVVATGLNGSDNSKTGDMIQVWILCRNQSPVTALNEGRDSAVCGDCIHRGTLVPKGDKTVSVGRRCYVNIQNAPTSIWNAYRRGVYPHASTSDYNLLFSGRMVRWGAYGDPFFINESIIKRVCEVAFGHTGYTHQWRNAPDWMRGYLMASCDSPSDAIDAVAAGWRYFRITTKGDETKLAREISCPASNEAGKRTVCAKCRLCDGATDGDRRKNIVIQDHSRIASSNPFVMIG